MRYLEPILRIYAWSGAFVVYGSGMDGHCGRTAQCVVTLPPRLYRPHGKAWILSAWAAKLNLPKGCRDPFLTMAMSLFFFVTLFFDCNQIRYPLLSVHVKSHTYPGLKFQLRKTYSFSS